jgi:hypothetical protein
MPSTLYRPSRCTVTTMHVAQTVHLAIVSFDCHDKEQKHSQTELKQYICKGDVACLLGGNN